MPVCILTDTTASFTPASAIHDHLYSLFPKIENGAIQLPVPEDFSHSYDELKRRYTGIFVLTASKEIFPGYQAALQAAQSHGGTTRISVFDSHQTGPGLGLLAQLGAQAASGQATLTEIEQRLRSVRPHFYTLLCPAKELPAGTAEKAPLAIYSLEEGAPSLYKKVRSPRHLMGCLQEFIEEFDHPQQIAYLHGQNTCLRAHTLRETANGLFPTTPFNEMELNPTLAALFGPQTVGLTLMELPR